MADIDVYKEWLGIPEGDRPPDLYQLLRVVQFEDSEEKIRAHYKKLNAHVRKYATGQYSLQSQDLLNELAKAMLCLTDPERKRDYDESLGREFDDDADAGGRKPLLRYLAEQGSISRDQIPEVESYAEARGLSERDSVVQMKLAEADVATQALSQQLGLPYVDLDDMLPDDSVLDRIPRNVIKRHSFLPLFIDDDVLLIACADEPDQELEDDLRIRFGIPMRSALATPLSINQAIARYYAPGVRDEAVETTTNKKTGKKQAGKPKRKKQQGPKRKEQGMANLPPEEQRERRMLGIIMMCWAIIGSVLLDYFFLTTFFDYEWPFRLVLVVAPLVIFYVLRIYWK